MSFSITKNGKPLDKFLYTWDEKTQTLSTNENNLVLDFANYNDCTFRTGFGCTFRTGHSCTFSTGHSCTFDTMGNCIFNTSYGCTFDTGDGCTFNTSHSCTFTTMGNCTFKTGSDCSFDTHSNCTFNTGHSCTFKTDFNCSFDTSSKCTFNTGHSCTFVTGYSCTFNTDSDCVFNSRFNSTFVTGSDCVLVRRDIFESYDISEVKNLTIAPCGIKGYVKNGYYYEDSKRQCKAIIADGILSEIIEHKGNVYKVKNYGETEITYLVQDGDVYSHGKTLKEAKEGLIYKLSNRDTSVYKGYTLGTKVSKKEAIQMYRAITGACGQGTRMFVESLEKVPKALTIKKIIDLTEGQYGNDTFRKFFEEVSE